MNYYAVIFDRNTLLTESYPFSTLNNKKYSPLELLSINTEKINYAGFHNDFIKPQEVRKWWHYMESLYIIGTEWSAQMLSEHFTKTAQAHGIPQAHIVLEVNLRSRFGWLPKDAWDWIDKEAANIPLLRSLSDP
jgi:hypothetical protein